MHPNDVPQEVVDAFTAAWRTKNAEYLKYPASQAPDWPPGTKTRAGIAAALNVLPRDEAIATKAAVRDLLGEFTTYPSEGRSFSINDHMFLDFKFWDRLLDIVDGTTND